jgi:hypothetical protein
VPGCVDAANGCDCCVSRDGCARAARGNDVAVSVNRGRVDAITTSVVLWPAWHVGVV